MAGQIHVDGPLFLSPSREQSVLCQSQSDLLKSLPILIPFCRSRAWHSTDIVKLRCRTNIFKAKHEFQLSSKVGRAPPIACLPLQRSDLFHSKKSYSTLSYSTLLDKLKWWVFVAEETPLCGIPDRPAHGDGIQRSSHLYEFRCQSGFHLVGSRFAHCQNGRWTEATPTCVGEYHL